MTMDEKRIISWVECRLLWDRLSKADAYGYSGEGRIKKHAIQELHKEGLLAEKAYLFSCPFCEFFWHPAQICPDCPWPEPEGCCQTWVSPYTMWKEHPTPANAKKVCEMLDRIEF